MSTTVRGLSPILDGYLDELDAATAHLPADEAYEIRDSIAAHIADATHGASHVADDDARRIVRDLGPVPSTVPRASVTPSGEAPDAPPASSGARAATSQPPMNSSRIAIVLATVTTATMFFVLPLAVLTGLVAIGFGVTGLRRHEPNRGEAWTAIICGALPFILMAVFALMAVPVSGSVSVG